MKPEGTLKRRCSFCNTLILVTQCSPNPKARIMLNGYWVTSMDEDYRTHNRGFICEPCLNRFCFEKSVLSFGGFGRVDESFENCEAIIDNDSKVASLLEAIKKP